MDLHQPQTTKTFIYVLIYFILYPVHISETNESWPSANTKTLIQVFFICGGRRQYTEQYVREGSLFNNYF